MSLLAGVPVDAAALARVHAALAAKDASELRALTSELSRGRARGPAGAGVAVRRREGAGRGRKGAAAQRRRCSEALANLNWLAGHLQGAKVSFDLADLRGYAYYSGARFAIYTPGASDALVRGGRYDEVGAVFGRNRPAVGFSLDVKELVAVVAKRPLKAAIRAPWLDGAQGRGRAARRNRRTARPGRNRGLRAAGPRQRNRRIPMRPRAGAEPAGQWVVKAI